MNDDDSNSDEDPATLSSGDPLPVSWTPVDVLGSATRIRNFRRALSETTEKRGESSAVTRDKLNSWFQENAEGGLLTVNEFNAVIVGLEECGVASERDTRGATYADSEFRVDVQSAVRVLDKWQVAARYEETRFGASKERTDVQLVATLPPDAPSWLSSRVDRTNLGLRHLAVQAQDSVRIAAPYLDPDEKMIEDIASLPDRGVTVRLLTRESTGEDVDPGQRKSLERLANQVSPSNRNRFVTRDLYSTDSSGRQERAVHAKAVIIDETRAYVGSANFTQTGLSSNFELGVLLDGPLVDDCVTVFDEMFDMSDRILL